MKLPFQSEKEPLSQFIIKVGIVGLILLIALAIIFGFVFAEFDPLGFILNIIGIVLLIALLALAVKGLLSFLKPKPFSPTESFKETLIRICRKAKPFNVHNLYLRGEDMRTHAKWGKIIGVGYLPYVTAHPEKDATGKALFEKNEQGKMIYDKTWSFQEQEYVDTPRQKYKLISEKDGDTVFIVDKQKFPISIFFRGVDLIRVNRKYHSDILGDVFIKDVNLVPYGEYLYPAKQWQNDIIHIMKENEAIAITQTHRNNLDLVATVTQMSLGGDPTFQKIMVAQSERLSTNTGIGFNQQ